MTEQKGVEAVERALSILNCFSDGEHSLGLAEIARRTGFYKSTILRLAVSLERFGYLVRQEDGLFRLGPALWHLGAHYRQNFDLAGLIRPELQKLSEATEETASYYVREGNQRICLFRSEPTRSIRHAIIEGLPMSLDHGASSKVLKAWTERETDDWVRVRSVGYAISRGERDPEVGAYAVPLLTSKGTLMGALAVSGPLTRLTRDREKAILDALIKSQEALGNQLGC